MIIQMEGDYKRGDYTGAIILERLYKKEGLTTGALIRMGWTHRRHEYTTNPAHDNAVEYSSHGESC